MFEKSSLEQLFEALNKALMNPVTLFLIGGGNMSLRGLKPTTKDIDIVLTSIDEFYVLKPAIELLGYKSDEGMMKEAVYQEAVVVFKDSSGSRIDIFIKTICKQLALSTSMVKRSEEYLLLERLSVRLLSPEDIFLFKSLTDRMQDIEDCYALINSGLDWDVIINECVLQHRKDVKWIFWLYEHLCRIEEAKGITLPAKARVLRICVDNWDKKPSDFMAGIPNPKKHLPDKELLKNLHL